MKKIIYSPRSNSPRPSMIAMGNVLEMLDECIDRRRAIVVTDSNLGVIYAPTLERFDVITIPIGEANKTFATVEAIHRQLLELEADRSTLLIGFGGGIVTDITGFAASTYMRGIDFGFVATSLLAQVDASVGGKNGVNVDGYKNIAGTFNQPEFVLCDSTLLATLPVDELRAGLCEALKCGIIGDVELFDIFRTHTFEQIATSPAILHQIIVRSVELKAAIVAQDEHEHGARKLLNLGHTFGHAIEKLSPRHSHGQAVSIGMAIIALMSTTIGELSVSDHGTIIATLEKLGLPTNLEARDARVARKEGALALSLSGFHESTWRELLDVVRHDKKREADHVSLVVIDKIGRCHIQNIELTELSNMNFK